MREVDELRNEVRARDRLIEDMKATLHLVAETLREMETENAELRGRVNALEQKYGRTS